MPGLIQKLSEDVINRIAAGEVVQRPSNAVKELVENSIDAGCTRVQVLATSGGLDVLQVSDDGSGIHYEDLPLLCERYATSKLASFEDLHQVQSFGFRGEALASISYVSRVTVTTKRHDADSTHQEKNEENNSASMTAPSVTVKKEPATAGVAWRCNYVNGQLMDAPQPTAGNSGTTIRAEKLFYNALVRRNSLRPSEEWSRIVDVISRYALAYPHVGFACQKGPTAGSGQGYATSSSATSSQSASSSGGISFPPRSTTLDNLRISHGSRLVSHLRFIYAYDGGEEGESGCNCVPVEDSHDGNDEKNEEEQTGQTKKKESEEQAAIRERIEKISLHVRRRTGPQGTGLFTLVGYTSGPTLLNRKPYLCLFINNRLVESSAIRKAVDTVYSSVLTGGNRPFTVLLLSVPTDRVDVNVHPTKKEVLLLDEDVVLARVAEVCRGAVLEAAAARQLDMLQMQRTANLALRAAGSYQPDSRARDGETQQTSAATSSSQRILQVLQEQHQKGQPLASPLTSPSMSLRQSTGLNGPAVVQAPCTMVRVEPQRGALDAFFKKHSGSGKLSSEGTQETIVEDEGDGDDGEGDDTVGEGNSEETGCGAREQPPWDAVLASLQRAVAPSAASAGLDTEEDNNNNSDRKRQDRHHDVDEDGDDEEEDAMMEFKKYRADVHATASTVAPDAWPTTAAAAKIEGDVKPEMSQLGAVATAADFLDEAEAAARQCFHATSTPNQTNSASSGAEARPPPSALIDTQETAPMILSSVEAIVSAIVAASSPTAEQLIAQLAFVGVVDGHQFLAQAGTTLLLLDTMQLVREAVFQRIFLRWGQSGQPAPSVFVLQNPIPLADLLYYALCHDVAGLTPPSPALVELFHKCKEPPFNVFTRFVSPGAQKEEDLTRAFQQWQSAICTKVDVKQEGITPSTPPGVIFFEPAAEGHSLSSMSPRRCTARYVRRLIRRLCRWRHLLQEYFFIYISQEGDVMGLPYGLNEQWPPLIRALPLFVWLLSEAVPYPTQTSQEEHTQQENEDEEEKERQFSEGSTPKGKKTSAVMHGACSSPLKEAEGMTAEVECFTAVGRHIADVLYGLTPPAPGYSLPLASSTRPSAVPKHLTLLTSTRAAKTEGSPAAVPPVDLRMEDVVQHGLFPCLKNVNLFRFPDVYMADGTVQSLVSVESLYKVFERC